MAKVSIIGAGQAGLLLTHAPALRGPGRRRHRSLRGPCDENAWQVGAARPEVREVVGRLPSGRLVMALGAP